MNMENGSEDRVKGDLELFLGEDDTIKFLHWYATNRNEFQVPLEKTKPQKQQSSFCPHVHLETHTTEKQE